MQDNSCPEALRSPAAADGAVGWNAINTALAGLYPGQAPSHFGSSRPWTLGGQDPLDGISVYRAASPRPHWHYVTYGFSELFGKESDDPDVSGFGFELTFRLAMPAGAAPDAVPPTWPMNLLQNLARYVFASGNAFAQGHHMNANGPIAVDHDTTLRHLVLMEDPQLPPRATPHGQLQFLQVIGLTDGEMAAVIRWRAEEVLQVMQAALPLWITDLTRGDVFVDAGLAAQVEAGSRRDGSSTSSLFVETLDWSVDGDTVTLQLGAAQVGSLLQLMAARLPFGHAVTLVGRERQWTLAPGAEDSVQVDGDQGGCTWRPATLAHVLQTLQPVRGLQAACAGLRVEVMPSVLRDGRGEVVATVG